MIFKRIVLTCMAVLTISVTCMAQKNNICGEVSYKQIKKVAIVLVDDYLMKFDNDQSYSEEMYIKSSDNSQKTEKSKKGLSKINIIGRKNLDPRFFYNNKRAFYFREILPSQTLLVKENPHEWKWDLHQETKQIGKFTCQKATIKFRGRSYIAWFTNEVPVPFGPWKFQGLSGLILEVYDTDKVFHIIAYKIKIGKTVDCSINLDKTQLKKAITIADYLNKKEEFYDAMFAELSSKMPKGSPVLKRDKNCNDCGEVIEKF